MVCVTRNIRVWYETERIHESLGYQTPQAVQSALLP
jgi:transposase InsO family protein